MATLVEQARSAFQSPGARQAVRIDLPADLPRVMADERRIVQVLGNLFSNAARHSPESSPIHVGAVRERFEDAQQRLASNGLQDQPLADLSNGGLPARQLELPRNANRLISSVAKQSDLSGLGHGALSTPWHMIRHRSQRG